MQLQKPQILTAENDSHFKQATDLSEFKVTKLAPSTSPIRSMVVQLESALVGFRSADFSRQVDMTLPSDSFTIMLPTNQNFPTINGVQFNEKHVFYTSLPTDIRMLAPTGYSMVFIKLPFHLLSLISDSHDSEEIIELSKWRSPVRSSEVTRQNITSEVWNSLLQISNNQTLLSENKTSTQDYEDFIIRSVSHFMSSNLSNALNSTNSINTRARLVDRALQYMESSTENVTVSSLAKHLHTSIRTLEYAFLDCIGITPKKYIVARRMNVIRQTLKVTEPRSCSLKSILNKFGIVNTSRFSQDYRKLFNVSPLETLNS